MRRLIAAIFRLPLAWTRDFDGEVRLRVVWSNPWDEHIVRGVIWWRVGPLQADGSIGGETYMRNWKPANKLAEGLFK